jgi:hypothetical protein
LADKVKIDAKDLADVRLSADGTRITLDLRDEAGKRVTLSLPAGCMNALLTAVPRTLDAGAGSTHKVDSWSMSLADDGKDLLLTLSTPEAASISFTLKSWQVEGMATLATYGNRHRPGGKTLH